MKRIMMMLALAALTVVALSLSAFPSFAASPAEEACEDADGRFVKTGPGQFTCILPVVETNPGNPQSENAATPKKEQTSKTQTGQGGGGGEARSEQTCVYNNGGKLQENRSDPGCPATQQ